MCTVKAARQAWVCCSAEADCVACSSFDSSGFLSHTSTPSVASRALLANRLWHGGHCMSHRFNVLLLADTDRQRIKPPPMTLGSCDPCFRPWTTKSLARCCKQTRATKKHPSTRFCPWGHGDACTVKAGSLPAGCCCVMRVPRSCGGASSMRSTHASHSSG